MKAILVGVKLDETIQEDFDEELQELAALAKACDIETASILKQNLPSFNPLTYVGSGKIEELKMYIDAVEADVVICNDELTPLQISTISDRLNISVFDRTYLILEIFKRRAKTKEAIIQVEIASLSYLLPRLQGMRKGLSRQRGAGGGFAHGRGAGETKLELDRRINNDKIAALRKELKELEKVRRVQRKQRNKNDVSSVCLVGYTNSGKSTLMNKILEMTCSKEEKKVFQKDMLFATLETASRKINYKEGNFILTDTVGFIEKLPHNLVEAFKSTLEEIKECDLIVHVVDISNSKYLKQIEATEKVLQELDVKDIPIIYAFNKIDKIDNYIYIPKEYTGVVRISALQGKNVDELLKNIFKRIYSEYQEVSFAIPYGKENIYYKIKDKCLIDKTDYTDAEIIVSCKANKEMQNKYNEYIIRK